MKIYVPTPQRIIRVAITRQGEEAKYISLIETSQEEMLIFIRDLLNKQITNSILILEDTIRTRIDVREAIGSKNGKSKSLSFFGLSAEETYNLIYKSVK